MEKAAYSQDRWQGVHHVLHCKIEDKEWATTPLLLFSSSPRDGACIALLLFLYLASRLHSPLWRWGVHCILHREKDTRITSPTPHPRAGVCGLLLVVTTKYEALALLFPPCNWVCSMWPAYLLLLFNLSQIKLGSMTSTHVLMKVLYCSHKYIVRFVYTSGDQICAQQHLRPAFIKFVKEE